MSLSVGFSIFLLLSHRVLGAESQLSTEDENCRDMYFNCNVVVQARLCVYTYYKTACCASCAKARRRASQLRRR